MNKVQKSLAKLYFALGESGMRVPMNAEIDGASVEYLACLAIRDTGNFFGRRYFAMGVSSARRRAAEPPGGKRFRHPDLKAVKPPGGKKPVEQAEPGKRGSSRSKCIRAAVVGAGRR